MATTKRFYSQKKISVMMDRARATTIAMREAEVADREYRASDPLELAKLALRRAGRVVFAHSVLAPGSSLIVVGNRTMTSEEVIAHAVRFGR